MSLRSYQVCSMDGLLLYMIMCNHVHRNHLAFVKSIKNKICTKALANHGYDISTYIQFLQDNLRVIISTGDTDIVHNDLLPHIFLQLWNTMIPIFLQKVLEWQCSNMENKLPIYPSKLATMVEEVCQILKCSNQCVETIDPSVVAMWEHTCSGRLKTQARAIDPSKYLAEILMDGTGRRAVNNARRPLPEGKLQSHTQVIYV